MSVFPPMHSPTLSGEHVAKTAPQTSTLFAVKTDYFTRFAEQLCILHEQDPDNTSWAEVSAWLQEAPSHASDSAMPIWTNMMKLAVVHENRQMHVDPAIVEALGQYLDRVAALTPEHLAKTLGLPMFQSLADWMKPAGTREHSFVEALAGSGWQPAALLRSLDDNRDTIVRMSNAARGYPRPFDETGAGLLFRHIGGLFCSGSWTPTPDPVYEVLFEAYIVSSDGFKAHDCTFIRGMLEAAPSGLYKALWFARRQEFFRPEHLHMLFPLPLGHGNDAYMLESLVDLVVDEPPQIKGMVMPLLAKYHPELSQLVALHLSLFPDARPGQTHAQTLLEPYQRLRGLGSGNAQAEPIDASVFESP